MYIEEILNFNNALLKEANAQQIHISVCHRSKHPAAFPYR